MRLLEAELPDLSDLDPHELRDYFADTHYATPLRALAFVRRIGKLPSQVQVLGCEPESFVPLLMGLSPCVSAAIDKAVDMALSWVEQQQARDPGR